MLFASQIHDFLQSLPSRRLKRKKQELRTYIQQKMNRMTDEERAERSRALVEQIKQNEDFQKAKVVMLYYPIQHEPDIRPLLEEYKDQKTLLLPIAHRKQIEMRRYTGHDNLHRGRFGIPEPKGEPYNGEPELIIVPGVAFDENGNRLGRGGGYYDRFLKRFRKAQKIALAYDFQIVEKVPMATFDVKIDKVLYSLALICALLFAGTSCEKNNTTTTRSSDTKLTGIVFATNTNNPGISDAVFTMDYSQDTALAYNLDSLKYGTRLDSVVTTFYFSTNIGYAMFSSTYVDSVGAVDTIVKLISAGDTLDFRRQPCLLYVLSEDQSKEQYYHIYVNVHQVDPDLYVWKQTQDALFQGSCDVQAVLSPLDESVLLFTQDGLDVQRYTSVDGTVWSAPQMPTGLPKDANVRGIVRAESFLYYTQGNQLYTSKDGLSWNAAALSGSLNYLTMLFFYNDSVWALAEDPATNELWFATMAEGGTLAKQTQIGAINSYYRTGADRFPVSDFSALAFEGKSGRLRAMVMGGFDAQGRALNSRWNLEWLDTDEDEGYYRLENFTIEQPEFAPLTGASIVWYDDKILLFGSADRDQHIGDYPILESLDEGMNWAVPDSAQNRLPADYPVRQRQAVVVTNDDAILLVGGRNQTTVFADVWRGRKNSIDW